MSGGIYHVPKMKIRLFLDYIIMKIIMPKVYLRDVLDEILDVIESVSEGFLTYSYISSCCILYAFELHLLFKYSG